MGFGIGFTGAFIGYSLSCGLDLPRLRVYQWIASPENTMAFDRT